MSVFIIDEETAHKGELENGLYVKSERVDEYVI